MHIKVNGTRLWFDVDGPAPMADGGRMRQRPTVVLVHGGPGVYDHSHFKPDFARLTEHAQVIYLDLRGHGRSEWGDAAGWSFETCAMDARTGIGRSSPNSSPARPAANSPRRSPRTSCLSPHHFPHGIAGCWPKAGLRGDGASAWLVTRRCL